MENINGELEIVLVTGKRVHVPVRKYDTIMYVKNQIYKSENIPIQNQRLIANATILQDDWTIGEMELFKNSHIETVHLVLKLSGVSDINKEIQPYVQGDNGQKMAYASTPQQQQKKKKRKAKYNQEGRKRGSYAKRACSHCKQAHAACDSGRPCKRCIMLGKEDTCRDVERKSRRKDNIDYSKEFPDLTSFVDRVAALPDIDEATRHRHNHQIWEQQEQESAMLRSQQQQQPIFLSSPPPPPQQQQQIKTTQDIEDDFLFEDIMMDDDWPTLSQSSSSPPQFDDLVEFYPENIQFQLDGPERKDPPSLGLFEDDPFAKQTENINQLRSTVAFLQTKFVTDYAMNRTTPTMK